MQLEVKKTFTWAHQHVNVQQHTAGEVIETEDEDLIRVACEEGWAAEVKDSKAKASKEDTQSTADPAAE
jgi:hypothetical protein